MKNVIIFPAGSYPGVEIYFALKYNLVFHPIMAGSQNDHVSFVTEDYIDTLPYIYESNFFEEFNKVLLNRKVEYIIPTHDTVAKILSERSEKLLATVVCSPKETANICRYKSKIYDCLRGSYYVPVQYKMFTTDATYPLFSKPDDSQGGKGAKKIATGEEFKEALTDSNNVICEYLPGEEYTIDCFTDKNRELIFTAPRKRSRILYGVSVRAESVDNEGPFIAIAEDINKKIVFRGYWFFQVKEDINGNLKLLEISTRFPGALNHSLGYGVNLPLMALYDFAGMDVSVIKNDYRVVTDKTFIDRYLLDIKYDRVYIDYDDTITDKGGKEVNPFTMAFLYQCRNLKKDIIVLSRHSAFKGNDLSDDMKILGISTNLFTKVIDLPLDEEKSMYIDTSVPSIFIDNSFAERKKIFEQFGLPVFDVAQIKCLFDWRK